MVGAYVRRDGRGGSPAAVADSTGCLAAHLLDREGARAVAIEVERGGRLGRPVCVLASVRGGPGGITTRVGGLAVVRDGHLGEQLDRPPPRCRARFGPHIRASLGQARRLRLRHGGPGATDRRGARTALEIMRGIGSVTDQMSGLMRGRPFTSPAEG
ncbi:hypothetical protein A7J05_02615 [Streptomyces alfalfae]|uniref:Uncharacterized protein n=1 Tax=Streptomyces alfalfae TaxID=1642299 RepID=A0ABN4VFX9_9ACTN|nr:hypothetical protein A7J05_02615 [Streptomyces alfalfae]